MTATLVAAGAKDIDIPVLADVREEFDRALESPFEKIDAEREALLRALGLRSAG